jgi:hypothetical protein
LCRPLSPPQLTSAQAISALHLSKDVASVVSK